MLFGFIVLSLIGIGLCVGSLFYLKEGALTPSFNPKNWVPVWRQKSFFRGPGYTIMIVGMTWWGIGTAGWVIILFLR